MSFWRETDFTIKADIASFFYSQLILECSLMTEAIVLIARMVVRWKIWDRWLAILIEQDLSKVLESDLLNTILLLPCFFVIKECLDVFRNLVFFIVENSHARFSSLTCATFLEILLEMVRLEGIDPRQEGDPVSIIITCRCSCAFFHIVPRDLGVNWAKVARVLLVVYI